jgi:guanylate kinase
MANEANMYYRFTSDNEPEEEQLSLLMQEAREEVREKNSNLQSVITKNIQREYENIKKIFPNL